MNPPAFSAPTVSSSIKTESAARCRALASSSTLQRESAKPATKATLSSMASAPRLTPQLLLTLAAPPGTRVFVPNAPRDGISMQTRSAPPSPISALNGTNLVLALLATMALLSAMVPVSSIMTSLLFPIATSFARPGVARPVPNAPTELTSMPTASAHQSVLNATPSIRPLVTALPALLDMMWLMVLVSTHLLTLLLPLILDAENGTGPAKNAWLAQTDGLSTPTMSVFQLLINALLMMKRATA